MSHKIIIVEDNPSFSIKLERHLVSWGHQVVGIFNSGEVFLENYEELESSLMLLDISLSGNLSGLEVANRIKDIDLPVIYITGHNDMATYDAASGTNSIGFLVKPFDMLSLKSIIDFQLEEEKTEDTDNPDFLYLKKKGEWVKVQICDISWIQSDKNYCDIYVGNKMFTEKISITKLLVRLNNESFVKTHKSYVVNVDLVSGFSYKDSTVIIDGENIPVGRKYKKELIERLKLNQSKMIID